MTRLVLVLSIVAWSGTVSAQPAGAQAEVLFREGRQLMAAGKYAEACAALEQSQKLEPATTTLVNLAGCREKLGQFATAWGLFLEAERKTRSATDPTGRQLHGVAKERAAKLEARVSKLAINVPDKSRMDGLEVTRDNQRVESVMWNRALPIDGGTYTITARAPGTNEWSTKVTVGNESDTKTVDIPDLRNLPRDLASLQPSEPASAAVAAPADHAAIEVDEVADSTAGSGGSRSKLVPLLITGASVALFGGAIGFHLWGNAAYDDAKAEMMDQARRDTLYESANNKRYVATGLAVAGVGAAGVAVWLYLRERSESSTVTAHRRQVVVSPLGIALVGRF